MKLELTDKQVYDILEQTTQNQLYTYLARNKSRGFKLFVSLLLNHYNTESYVKILKNLLEKIPIQKELF